ncbi:MAG TPA: hypothetical protein QGI39_03400, partial [Gammaproteobacteria bacterium]|nr:hypothetical protein [Gammaproteobacteria bacterium]
MNAKASNRNKYSAYCEEHLKEFTDDLRDDASWALTSWPGRALALLLTVSSLLNYVDASGRDNPFALYILFAYTVPIFIVVLFPAATLFASTLEKYSPIVLDLLCLTGLISYCLALFFIFSGTELIEEFQSFSVLLSQVNFILLLSTAFSYHATYKITLVRNVTFAILLTIALSYIVPSFSSIIQIQVVQGI